MKNLLKGPKNGQLEWSFKRILALGAFPFAIAFGFMGQVAEMSALLAFITGLVVTAGATRT